MVGEYSVRGGILDVFSPEAAKPVRIELFGDQIESIRRFEVESQRSVLKIEECTLLPLTEYQKSRALLAELTERLREAGVPARDLPAARRTVPRLGIAAPAGAPARHVVFSTCSNSPIVVWDEPEQIRGAAERLWKRLEQVEPIGRLRSRAHLLPLGGAGSRGRAPSAGWRSASWKSSTAGAAPACTSPRGPSMAFHGNMQVAVAEARDAGGSRDRAWRSSRASTGELERLADILREYGSPFQLGLDQSDATPAYLAERAYLAGSVASTYLVKGGVRARRGLPRFASSPSSDRKTCSIRPIWSRGPRRGKSQLAAFAADLAI